MPKNLLVTLAVLILIGSGCDRATAPIRPAEQPAAKQSVPAAAARHAQPAISTPADITEAPLTTPEPVPAPPPTRAPAPVPAPPVVPAPVPPPISEPKPVVVPVIPHPAVPAPTVYVPDPTPAPVSSCCKICSKGKACGDSCISRSYTCHKGPGCACDAY
jgi:hypothetical protein